MGTAANPLPGSKRLNYSRCTKSCKNMLMFNASMFNDAGGLIRTEPIVVGPYTAGTKALISKDVIADPQMQKSNQVTRLVLSGVRCT